MGDNEKVEVMPQLDMHGTMTTAVLTMQYANITIALRPEHWREVARGIPEVAALVEAARRYVNCVSDAALSEAEAEWGFTNVEVVRGWRDLTQHALRALGVEVGDD